MIILEISFNSFNSSNIDGTRSDVSPESGRPIDFFHRVMQLEANLVGHDPGEFEDLHINQPQGLWDDEPAEPGQPFLAIHDFRDQHLGEYVDYKKQLLEFHEDLSGPR